MQDVSDAIATLKEITGLRSLAFNADEAIELVFDGRTSVYIMKIDDRVFELVTHLQYSLISAGEPSLRAMLQANHLGDATGGARLALDPETRRPMLCERVDVTLHDAASLEGAILNFLKHATIWSAPGAEKMLGDRNDASVDAAEAPDDGPAELLLRI